METRGTGRAGAPRAARPVGAPDPAVRDLAAAMAGLLGRRAAIGAPEVGVPLRLVVAAGPGSGHLAMIDPELDRPVGEPGPGRVLYTRLDGTRAAAAWTGSGWPAVVAAVESLDEDRETASP